MKTYSNFQNSNAVQKDKCEFELNLNTNEVELEVDPEWQEVELILIELLVKLCRNSEAASFKGRLSNEGRPNPKAPSNVAVKWRIQLMHPSRPKIPQNSLRHSEQDFF